MRQNITLILSLLIVAASIYSTGCRPELNEEDWEELGTMGPLEQALVPPSPTNAYADDAEAATLGQLFFFDERMSSDGTISCASCHDPRNNFAGVEAVDPGVEGRRGDRHAPTLMNVAFQEFYFWDGRTDSLWSTPLQAIEASAEGNFTRVEVAHLVADHYREPYEALFGPLLDTSGLPTRAAPGDEAWEALSPTLQEEVNAVFSNVGKSLEAYQRQLLCGETKFDRVLRGEASFSAAEEAGAAMFVRDDLGNCAACHSGVNLTDNAFHNLKLGGDDQGRFDGVTKLEADLFNATGQFSDDTGFGEDKLADLEARSDGLRGQFKTPTLRGVTQRGRLGHRGNIRDVEQWLDTVYDDDRGGRRGGRGNNNNNDLGIGTGPGTLDPEADDLEFNEDDMEAFLGTLACPPLPARLIQRPSALPEPPVAQ